VPPKIKKVYKAKEKVIEQNFMVPSIPPLREEKKPMVDKPTTTQSQLENQTNITQNAIECRHRHRAIAHFLQKKCCKYEGVVIDFNWLLLSLIPNIY
jgi:hypothetical protein